MSIERRQTKGGATRWDVRLRRPDGGAYKRTFRTRKDAERFENQEIADRSRGTWIDPQAGRMTLAEWAEEWFASNQHRWRPRTVERNSMALRVHWLPALGHREISSISPRQVQAVVNDLVAKYKPMTVRGYYSTFRAMLSDAVEMDVIGRSPCRGIRLPPAKPAEKRVITPEDLHRLADAVGERWRAMIYLAGFMGLRFGEIAALRLSDIDLTEGRVAISKTLVEINGRLEVGQPKTSASIRTLDLPGPLLDEISRHIKAYAAVGADELVFADRFGGQLRRSNFRRRVFDPAVEAAGLDGLTFHGLRHSAATAWMASGADLRTVQHLLGHADPRLVLRLYAHANQEAVRRGGELASVRFWGQSP